MPLNPLRLTTVLLLLLWATIVAFGGGLACGWCVSRIGEVGALSLAACGVLAGYVWSTLTRSRSKMVGACLAISIFVAFLIAETCWLHWNTRNGEPSWQAAIECWPAFLREYTLAAVIGLVCTAYGAWSAFGSTSVPDTRRSARDVNAAPPP